MLPSSINPAPTENSEKLSAKQIIERIVPDYLAEPELKPSQFIAKYWQIYQTLFSGDNRGINGRVFEELILITLMRSDIFPIYLQARVAFVPNVHYDILIFGQEGGPIVLSAKTSIRERYKQADLEAVALRYIYRTAKSYLISLSEGEVNLRKRDMASVMALDGFVLATSPEFDDLVLQVSRAKPILAPEIKTVESSFIITSNHHRV
jgi:hypothetical protein